MLISLFNTKNEENSGEGLCACQDLIILIFGVCVCVCVFYACPLFRPNGTSIPVPVAVPHRVSWLFVKERLTGCLEVGGLRVGCITGLPVLMTRAPLRYFSAILRVRT